ncbi:hypothetical protein EXN66_Car017496 [Channa argus]|uniref:Uncharacterized protein n=1 Tax=Channa argus TaxID=215402 RepID=A0A6G1QHT7_CHAAH|nr:hypothetical protein EXN66_Car017496 [Channa argus]
MKADVFPDAYEELDRVAQCKGCWTQPRLNCSASAQTTLMPVPILFSTDWVRFRHGLCTVERSD